MIDQTGGLDEHILSIGRAARSASRAVAELSADERSGLLLAMADGIDRSADAILAGNRRDLDAAMATEVDDAMLDRLRLTPQRLGGVSRSVRAVAGQPDVLGTLLDTRDHANGMSIERVRVPLGVILMIYESRPNVTADAAALCFRSGNAVILRGGSEALHSNLALFRAMDDAGRSAGLPTAAIQFIDSTEHDVVHALLELDSYIDLVIPRGGEPLVRAVAEHARIPVLKHYKGVCHVYVDRAADPAMALRIAVNAKCQRPGVCNAVETLLIHRDVAPIFVPKLAEVMLEHGVEVRGDDEFRAMVPEAVAATEEDWSAEYLALILSVRIVGDMDDALEHIERYGSRHSDVIVTDDERAAERFLRAVDSAAVFVNASCRFNDGGEFGLGAEIGISTDKLHARGPCGAQELTTYKWVVHGTGQVRE